ncbi:hypothetical protein [Chamaesiphon sp. OTE_75_metabat_556]|uniref:hypothetical protein n=1 Tax=Chamaesiphon sp. OTE_75_metabat_556 TaxID=2964692 RepID=UPI00286A3810|nr:hypothetical protein [Chamaesiphon sp. OTE_75_metabat_556]
MASPINTYLVDDNCAPTSPKPALQQYDNYQIYDLYCVDRPVSIVEGYDFEAYRHLVPSTHKGLMQSWLAVQRYSPDRITLDFESIIQAHYAFPLRTEIEGKYVDRLDLYGRVIFYNSEVDFYANIYTPAGQAFWDYAHSLNPRPYKIAVGTGHYTAVQSTQPFYCWFEYDREVRYPVPADYLDLLGGYQWDYRRKPSRKIKLKVDRDCEIDFNYYRPNPYEPIPKLQSIDWVHRRIIFQKNTDYWIDFSEAVLGTVQIFGDTDIVSSLTNQIRNTLHLVTEYAWSDYLHTNIESLFAHWVSAYQALVAKIKPLPDDLTASNVDPPRVYYRENKQYEQNILHKLAANNNYWHNELAAGIDIGVDDTHPMFLVDDERAYNWHIQPQFDPQTGEERGIGTLVMDSINVINIAKALDANKFATDETDPDRSRVATIGWHVNRQSEVLGISVKPDGTIDEALEKTTNRRLHANGSEENNPQEYNFNGFGSKGTIVRYMPNKFSPNGTTAGGYRKVRNIPQLLAEFHEQANAAMGYQEGTAIEIQLDGETYRYPNQLALLTELFVTAKQTATYSKGSFFSSLIGEQSIKEVIAGLGLRTVDKYLEFSVAGKAVKLYYKGISASQSVRRKLSAVATNVGMIFGNIN